VHFTILIQVPLSVMSFIGLKILANYLQKWHRSDLDVEKIFILNLGRKTDTICF